MIRTCLVLAVLFASPARAASVPEALPGAPGFEPAVRARLEQALDAVGPGYVPRTRHVDAASRPTFTNRLLLESSPYLRQHAHNPVNWYPWGDEAFAQARALGRPVLVSIGYSTCHWCHVMEEESFDDVETARVLNASFIAIKVDRELRPDVDAIYMTAVQTLTGHGGWPLNVWLTPDREPFFGGTYFPPQDAGGRPGFRSVLAQLVEAWESDRLRVDDVASSLAQAVRVRLEGVAPQSSFEPRAELLARALQTYTRNFDAEWGGIGARQKFPSSLPVRLLLRIHRRTGSDAALGMAVRTLEAMARGGLQDQIGGGFHRYSVDRRWRVPHFEKMLYDNAQLVGAYLDGWQVTGRDEFARVARRTLDYVQREMTAPSGGFYSATDADSASPEGHMEEGRFFTWTPAEIDAALAPESAAAFKRYFGVTPQGDLEGRSVLHVPDDADSVAKELGVPIGVLQTRLQDAAERLYAARQRRPRPLLDDKILAGWNGLMISAFAQAGLAFDEPRYTDAAARAARLLLGPMRPDGRLRRALHRGDAIGDAFLEDYAFAIAGLLDLYEATSDPLWLREALSLQAILDRDHAAPGGGYFATAAGHETLLARQKPDTDGAVPSGNSVALQNLLRLHEWTSDATWLGRAAELLSAFQTVLAADPSRAASLLVGVEFLLDAPKEIILVAPAEGADNGALLAELRRAYVPNRVVVSVREGAPLDAHAPLVPLVRDKRARSGQPTAYVCAARVCDEPTSDPARLAEQLRIVRPLALGASP